MRKATARLVVIAASALIVPTLSLPTTRDAALPLGQRPNLSAAEARIRQISRAVPPIAPAVGRHVAHLRYSGLAMTAFPVIMSAWRGRITVTAPRPQAKADIPTPISRFYVVRGGDTLWVIANRYEVSIERLAAANGLRPTSVLSLGKKLKIPAMGGPEVASVDPVAGGPALDGASQSSRIESRLAAQRVQSRQTDSNALLHTVRSGDTTWVIARRYKIKVDDLIEANDLGEDGRIQPGQRLAIPGRQAADGRDIAAPRNRDEPRSSAADRPEPRTPRRIAFIWPSRGVLTSRFGMRYRRHHNGIDIASPTGTPIYAARDGVVTFAARRGGYGLVVYVDHGGGYTTVYGHASSLHVKVGDRVKRGELIARVGCTGSCTGSHVHFEVHEGTTPVNPLKHLR